MAISDSRYVSITTTKRDGTGVATPVWIAPLPGGRAGFTTASDAGKVKRIRNRPDVVLRPCDARGRVPDGARAVHATAAVVVDGPEYDQVHTALGRKYGLQFTLVDLGGRLRRRLPRAAAPLCGVVLTFAEV
ncbi:MAG TPA: PPOX class F420-dependent oxidoreductase [Aquihabitans sp.]|jgi:hypothetical protein|nr:PPOX class F420-dependent oxidoreductase [Aquihabitans sp.]